MKKTAILLLIALVFGAGQIMASGDGESGSASDTRYTISYFAPNGHMIGDDTLVETMLEEKLNINIELSHVDWQSQEQYNLMFASGDIPDVFTRGSSLEHYDEGITRSIPESWIREYGPMYSQICDDNPWAWIVHRSPDDGNEQLAIGGTAVDTPVDGNRGGRGRKYVRLDNDTGTLPHKSADTAQQVQCLTHHGIDTFPVGRGAGLNNGDKLLRIGHGELLFGAPGKSGTDGWKQNNITVDLEEKLIYYDIIIS